MQDLITSFIRTYAPIVAGAIISFLATRGVNLDEQTSTGLIIFLTGLSQAVYYLVARLLENKFPQFGLLLGSKKTPEYTK